MGEVIRESRLRCEGVEENTELERVRELRVRERRLLEVLIWWRKSLSRNIDEESASIIFFKLSIFSN